MIEVQVTSQDLEWVLGKIAAAKKPATSTLVSEQQKKQELRVKQSKETHLWEAYKASGWHPSKLDPLIKSFQPLISKRINLYKNRTELPTASIEHEHKKWFVKGLQSFDPTKGAQLNTHLLTNLKKAGRWVEANKNMAYISENISKNIGYYNAFKNELAERLGYEPDDRTILDHAIREKHPRLGVLSLKDVKRLNREQRKAFVTTGHEADLLSQDEVDPREIEVAHLIIPQLTPQERLVHEYTLGLNGKAKLKPGDIAKKLKMDNSKVSKLRSAIYAKMKPYLPT